VECFFQRYWHTSIYRNGEKHLTGTTNYNDSNYELTASMLVNCNNFVIQDAFLERYRSTERTIKMQRIPDLEGIEAYFGSGPRLRESLKTINDPVAASLFAETVRGIIQAETFLLRERGYASPEEYSKYWDDFYAGSCRYYSNLDRISCSWSDYAGGDEREHSLFTRFKSQHLFKLRSNMYLVVGSLSDSFHELNIILEVNLPDCRVLSAKGTFTRVPDAVCRESAAYLTELKEKELTGLSKKEIAGLLGKNQGCIHLIDIIHDAATTLALFIKKR